MKSRTIGRYWTKREVVAEFEKSDFKENGELKDEIADELGWNADETLHPWVALRRGGQHSFAAYIEHITAYYGKFLRKRGLPDCCAMSFQTGRLDEMEEWRIQDSLGGRNLMPLNVYLCQYRGIKEDTLEDLAASILWTAYVLMHFIDTNHDEVMKCAHELGRLDALFSIYSKKDKIRQKPRQPRRRAWAEKLAEDLKTCASRDEAWSTIEEAEETNDEPNIEADGRDWIVYRDGDDLVAKDNHTDADEKIRRTTFFRHYLKLNRR